MSSLKMISGFDDVLGMSSTKIFENILRFQIIRQCQNDVLTALLVTDACYRQQQVTALVHVNHEKETQ